MQWAEHLPYSWKIDDTYSGSKDLTNAGLTVEKTSGIVRGTSFNSASGKIIKFKVIVTDKNGAGEVAVGSPVYTINVKLLSSNVYLTEPSEIIIVFPSGS